MSNTNILVFVRKYKNDYIQKLSDQGKNKRMEFGVKISNKLVCKKFHITNI